MTAQNLHISNHEGSMRDTTVASIQSGNTLSRPGLPVLGRASLQIA